MLRSREILNSISNGTAAGILIFDANRNILETNSQFLKMLDYNGERPADFRWEALTPQEFHSIDAAKIKKLHQVGECSPWRKEFFARDGERVPVLVQPGLLEAPGEFYALIIDASQLDREQYFEVFAGGLLNLYDEERRRIAKELHDTTAQNLAALSMNLTMLGSALGDMNRTRELLTECNTLAEECLKEVRSLSYMLHPPLLDELGLESALRAFSGLFQRRTGVDVSLVFVGPIGRLPTQMELAIFRIAQESLFNVHQHSESTAAEVLLTRRGSAVELTVRDWGKGITQEAINGSGLGLAGMRERARLLGSQLEIEPADPGTLVRAGFRLEP